MVSFIQEMEHTVTTWRLICSFSKPLQASVCIGDGTEQ